MEEGLLATVGFSINSKRYSVDCGDGQEAQILSIARLIDAKAQSLLAQFGNVDNETLLLMIAILEFSDLDKARCKIAAMEAEAALKGDGVDEDRLAGFIGGIAVRLKKAADAIGSMVESNERGMK
jgi:cell division protein ZapA